MVSIWECINLCFEGMVSMISLHSKSTCSLYLLIALYLSGNHCKICDAGIERQVCFWDYCFWSVTHFSGIQSSKILLEMDTNNTHTYINFLYMIVYVRWSYLRRAIRHYPNIREMLSQSSKCAVCGESFLNTWLECVRFMDAHKVRSGQRRWGWGWGGGGEGEAVRDRREEEGEAKRTGNYESAELECIESSFFCCLVQYQWNLHLILVTILQELAAQNHTGTIPLRALLCSYKCFNSAGHSYYGVAFP
jgi:hypothetical protein